MTTIAIIRHTMRLARASRLWGAVWIWAAALLCSCSTTKYVGEGELLLDKVRVETDGDYDDINTQQMSLYVRQDGNARWFSSLKVPLATYSLSGRDSTKWINRALRSMGEPPAIYDTLLARRSCDDLRVALGSMGYLGASVEVDTVVKKHGRQVDATYILHPGEPYYLGRVRYVVEDSLLAQKLRLDMPDNQMLREGMRFSLANLDGERSRIANMLLNDGYYRFHKDYITYVADTVEGSKRIDLTLVLHRYYPTKQTTAPHPQYRIGKIEYKSGDPADSVIHLRESVLRNNTYLEEGELFRSKDLQRTYNRFGRLGAVKYTNITFTEDTARKVVDGEIQISTNKPNTISFQPEGTNTAGDLGAAASLTYQHRNLFGGSEQLSVELRGAYEAIRGLDGYDNDDFVEFSVETSLLFPRFIMPFISRKFARRTNATSEVSLLYDTQNRPEYHRRVLSLAWRYKWADTNHHDKYQIDLIDIDYVFMPWISDTFREEYLDNTESRNAILRYNYEDLLIMKFGLGYSYNNGKYAIKVNLETAGNLLDLVSHIADFSKNDDGQSEIFNIAFAQYVKGDFDFTRNVKITPTKSIVFHAGLGIAYPYGNSDILPFEKRYFSGGANSVRGWSVRELGPGKFAGSDGKIDFINQTGDLKLDLNIEYRSSLFWKFDGALFIDAGNIWTLRDYEDQPGGQFKFDEFLEQLAVSYGLGLRLNFDFFVLRFDFGMKAVDPAYASTGSEHYPVFHPDLSRDLTFHFAVGLPF